ncbi:MAG: UDP-N-acetylmuramate dehydrogenase [Candidatus Aminicenantes bacterium]|nr:UDP-N-acetylmuramate dehydrogenase [Candidatus Aminicenantes bacterium]
MFAPLASWLRGQGIVCRENAAIGPFLYFKIGGKVGLLVVCTSPAQMAASLQKIIAAGIPHLVIGGGSNIAFADDLTEAVALVYQSALKPSAAARLVDGQALQVDGGVKNQVFLSWCAAGGAGGFEFLSGIPGTMGGAAAVNAGAFASSMADVVLGADILDSRGTVAAIDADRFAFGYRESRFKFGTETILSLRLKYSPAEPAAIAAGIKKNLDYRLSHHPSYRTPSAGCFFKNPSLGSGRRSAGKLIEACGLKGVTCGGLAVAVEHGNFLLNRGHASFADLQCLENEIKKTVATRTGVDLEREVIYVAADGKKY